MTGCSSVNCTSSSRKKIRLFKFPANAARQAIWVQNMRRDKFVVTRGSYLCEHHFEASQFESRRQDGWKKLKPNAIPTLFDVPNPSPMIDPPAGKSKYKTSVTNQDCSQQLVPSIVDTETIFTCVVPECGDKLSARHRLPDPKESLEKFNNWLEIIGNDKLKTLEPVEVYNNYRICQRHFTTEDIATNMYLKQNAIPKLFLPDKETESKQRLKASPSPGLFEFVSVCKPEPEDDHGQSIILESSLPTDFCVESLELNKICICCLKVTNVSPLRGLFIGSVSVSTLYEALTGIKVNEEELPAMICPECTGLLFRIDDFVKMLNHSHKVLLKAANSINRLKTTEHDAQTYNLRKNEFIHQALKQGSRIPLDDDMFKSIGRQPQTKLPDTHEKSCEITPKKNPQDPIFETSDPNLNYYNENERKIEMGFTQMIGYDTWINESKVDVEKLTNNSFTNTKKINFVCNRCKTFSSTEIDKIEEHVMHVHFNEKECILCSRTYTRFQAMLYHVKTAHGNRKCCKVCLINFNNDQEAEEHKKSEAHCTCQFCGRQFRNRKLLYKHWRIHDSTRSAKCSECLKEYSTPQAVIRHKAIFHKNIRYLCDMCGRRYTTNSGLKLHYRVVHEGVRNVRYSKSYLCETCGKEMNSRYKLEVHKAKHIGHNFVCRRCYTSFTTKELHEQHINELNHQLFECQICGSTLVTSDAFKIHVENHSNSQRIEAKTWICTYCSKILPSKVLLKNHEKLHAGEGPYKCPKCNQAFVTLGHMKKHRVLHYRSDGIILRKQVSEKK